MSVFMAYGAARCLVPLKMREKAVFFGRYEEIAQLNVACSDTDTRVLLLTASAGTGKTALMHHWLWQCEAAGWTNFDAVLGWAFPFDIDEDDPQATVRGFLEYALAWFGVTFTAEQTCIEKASLLVKQLQEQRVLLILEHLPAAIFKRELEASGAVNCLYALLKPLVLHNPGLCLVTLEDMTVFDHTGEFGGHCLKLGNLEPSEGVSLLMRQGLEGNEKLLGKVSALFDHHPLTLTLLGSYLKEACGGDLGKLDTIPIWFDSQVSGRNTRRVLAAYENWLANTPELALVYVLSLFDRPVSMSRLLDFCRVAFRRRFFFIRQRLPSILSPLVRINYKKLLYLQQRLHDLHLLTPYASSEMLEMHTVTREFFYRKFQITFMVECAHLQEILRAGNEVSVALSPCIKREPEPVSVMENLLLHAVEAKNWRQAADLALQLHKCSLIQGNIAASVSYARQSVAFAHLGRDTLSLQQNLKLLTALLQQTENSTFVAAETKVEELP
jgi:hypothetical protein